MSIFKRAAKWAKQLVGLANTEGYKPTIDITYRNGWMSIGGNVYTPSIALKEALKIYETDYKEEDLSKHGYWMHLVANHSKDSLVKTAIYVQQEAPKEADNIKRCVTVSAHMHGVSIPESLCLMDRTTALMILIYAKQREMKVIDVDNQPMSDFVHVHKLPQIIDSVLRNSSITRLLFSQKVPPNIHNFMKNIRFTSIDKDKGLQAYQKVLTCIYLKAGLSIPSDYFYFDIEVHDYVKRSGTYEDHKYNVAKASAT